MLQKFAGVPAVCCQLPPPSIDFQIPRRLPGDHAPPGAYRCCPPEPPPIATREVVDTLGKPLTDAFQDWPESVEMRNPPSQSPEYHVAGAAGFTARSDAP